MVQPNDHVDVLGTFRFPAAEKGTQMDTVTLTILQNVTVLAVGQQLANQRSAADRRGNYSTITLSVSPKEAEMLVFAQQKGVLTFTLRNNTDPYVARDVQDVNFEYLRENIKKYTEQDYERMEAYNRQEWCMMFCVCVAKVSIKIQHNLIMREAFLQNVLVVN